ncbi:MAG: DNA polymerase III subunit delta [Gemmatimonadota bacterium]|nr:DNA polymerase III subunit delta [Gemmatimonadota bacterium]
MAANDPLKTLRDTLKKGTFDAVYYICGEDDFQKEDAMKQLIDAAVDPATRDFNLDVRRAPELDGKSVNAALLALPMMAQRRVVVLRDVSALRKEARKSLDRYLESPSTDVVLLLVETSGAKTDKALAKAGTVLEFAHLATGRIPNWITHYASTKLDARISSAAVELLQSAVGTNLYQLVAELDKLASYSDGREIDEDAVVAVVGIRRGETMADFLDQVAARNISRALELIPQVLSQPKTTAVLLVMGLATQMVAISWGKGRQSEGLSRGRLQGEYFELLKQSGSVYTGRSWGSATPVWAAAIDHWSEASLGRALDALLDADLALKDTKLSSEEQILATLVLSMCVDDSQSMAA